MASRVSLKTKGKGSSGKGAKGMEEKSVSQYFKEWSTWTFKRAKLSAFKISISMYCSCSSQTLGIEINVLLQSASFSHIENKKVVLVGVSHNKMVALPIKFL
ncbi:hypothetical protein SADUNF_Sadunf06G0059000 [Salix dunnii]|uniref:Uncharacterized protein n=1 Tax=Salix dunnii TaxID=1413687 RepID=A0A835K3A4_9ROSI|nr:hypothetical protein SADUNF_Sadunf06G0059000 [Salix dunnii]